MNMSFVKNVLQAKNKGDIEYVLLLVVIVFAVLITGIFNNFKDSSSIPNATYKIVTPTAQRGKETLQLKNIQFTIITPTPSPATRPSNEATQCLTGLPKDLSSLISQLKSTYGIHLYGSTISGGGALALRRATDVYQAMCTLFLSPTYVKNINSLRNTINIKAQPGPDGNCFAWTTSGSDLWMEEPCDQDIIYRYIVIHELTHVIQKGGAFGRNAHWAEWQIVWNVEKNRRIPTGPCAFEDNGDGGECEADAVAEFVYYKQYRNAWSGGPVGGPTLLNYPTQWPKWYMFAQSKIFGFPTGHDFYNP